MKVTHLMLLGVLAGAAPLSAQSTSKQDTKELKPGPNPVKADVQPKPSMVGVKKSEFEPPKPKMKKIDVPSPTTQTKTKQSIKKDSGSA